MTIQSVWHKPFVFTFFPRFLQSFLARGMAWALRVGGNRFIVQLKNMALGIL